MKPKSLSLLVCSLNKWRNILTNKYKCHMDLMLGCPSENPQSSRLTISNTSADFKLLSSNKMTELQQETLKQCLWWSYSPLKLHRVQSFPGCPSLLLLSVFNPLSHFLVAHWLWRHKLIKLLLLHWLSFYDIGRVCFITLLSNYWSFFYIEGAFYRFQVHKHRKIFPVNHF